MKYGKASNIAPCQMYPLAENRNFRTQDITQKGHL
jgi:hypothetical protein